ncbi:hypothetical protein GII30_18380 [Gordonia amarae]|uniref:Secreted protein n=2 Tax=Gordonia amarae TaxID=36821 RepID=G7GR56_9ACTN|nr:hypothetical protein [Gordonia amarae]MCS3880398.1 hypothetical protein [Gordonia amarae]QHN18738.1 hypothetical protein GII35_18740 [Gordonia amarae]QHN23213.1 hypothetical protein GII34_18240 [Gordonia amarae]QHN32115.1 hypothetical protein GII32_18550 [Gordonia amarae]QHN40861.1 hypothetical protein GII30_18380 [Gordonia amarae]
MNLRSRRIAGVLAGLAASVMVGTGTAHAWDAYPGSTGGGSVSNGKVNITLTNRINRPITCEYSLYPLNQQAGVYQVSQGYLAARAAYRSGDYGNGSHLQWEARGKEQSLGWPIARRTNLVVSPGTTRTVSWRPYRAGRYSVLVLCNTGFGGSRNLHRDFDSNAFAIARTKPGLHTEVGILGMNFGS